MKGLVKAILPRHCDDGRVQFGGALAQAVAQAMCRTSGVPEDQVKPRQLKWPHDVSVSAPELASAFLGATALARFLLSPVRINLAKRLV
jgi:hypothetical protein